MRNGLSMWPRVGRKEFARLRDERTDEGKYRKDCGIIEAVVRGGPAGGVLFVMGDGVVLASIVKGLPKLKPPVSTKFRDAMISSISHSWNRSTTSAHVSWKRLSFSNFLKTVDLISTNWFERSKVMSAFEYEFTATLSVMTW